jgi:hypothetical protein
MRKGGSTAHNRSACSGMQLHCFMYHGHVQMLSCCGSAGYCGSTAQLVQQPALALASLGPMLTTMAVPASGSTVAWYMTPLRSSLNCPSSAAQQAQQQRSNKWGGEDMLFRVRKLSLSTTAECNTLAAAAAHKRRILPMNTSQRRHARSVRPAPIAQYETEHTHSAPPALLLATVAHCTHHTPCHTACV